ncbi:hypothetical protein BD410DRAFT_729785, partial [Rickenella mellea]
PCSAPLSSLHRKFLKELKLSCDYREAVVILRTLVPPRRFGDALQTVVEDEQGTCIYLRLYGPVVGAHIDHFLPEGSIVAVKAPWCQCNKNHGTAMVVQHLTDFVRLPQGGVLYPDKWNLSVPPSAPYTEALNIKPSGSLEIAIYSNRAQAHLATGAFEAAIVDETFVLSREPQHEKSLYRCAMGHYAMQNYAATIELLNSLIQAYPSNQTAQNDLQRATQRVKEQTTGAYDFSEMLKMLKVSRGPYPQIDVADYIGPMNQQANGFSATRNVTAGELLMCTKAFEFSYANINNFTIFYDSKTCLAANAAPLRLSRKIAQKLVSNPSYVPSLRELRRPSLTMVADFSDELVDGRPVIDDYLIESILKPHTFTMPCVHGTEHNYTGIGWSLKGSYIRHDCLGNCTRAVIGDVVFYRASRDIEIGAEILVPYVSAGMPVDKRQERLRSYGIYCTCRLCQSQLAESKPEMDKHRCTLLGTAPSIDQISENPVKAARELDELCTLLESTYVDPPTIHPRFSYTELLSSLSICCTMTGRRKKFLETLLRGLSAMGFEAQIDESGHLLVLRHGHCGPEVVWFAVMQASWLMSDGLASEAASWKAIAKKALDIQYGHRSFHTKPVTMGPIHPIDFSDFD